MVYIKEVLKGDIIMKKKITILITLAISIFTILMPINVIAMDPCNGSTGGPLCPTATSSGDLGPVFKTIANTLLFLIGATSVIVLVIAGIRYVVSGGNAEGVKNAKNSILYAVIGIIVAVSGYAIVNFVLGQLQ